MDSIRIENLEVYAGHGVFPEETSNGQMFLVSAVLMMDLHPAGVSDELTLSTHYGEVCKFTNSYLRTHTFQLIEAATEQLAKAILLNFPLIRVLELELKKPHAPIGLPFSCVSVRIERGWKKVYLGIGSNIGDRKAYIEQALKRLGDREGIRRVRCSKLLYTKPYGGVKQEDFLNGALLLETLLTPQELLEQLHRIEQHAHRERTVRWGPRTLDLDILIYDDVVMDTEELTLPHKDMLNRDFVMKPLAQVAPGQIHPVERKTIRQLWEAMKITHVYS